MSTERRLEPQSPVPEEANSGQAAPVADPLPFVDTLMNAPPQVAKAAAAESVRFARLRLHAAGGMGRVWIARDERLERDVALKELRPEFGENAEVGRRFLAEARITGRLEHPGIVPIYEMVREGGAVSYAMRLLRGRTLTEAIKAYHTKKKETPAGLERAALLQNFSAVCTTVAFAHARGVIHRDLKGQNILLGDFGEAIVLDWGLAKEERSEDTGVGNQEKTEVTPNAALLTPAAPLLPSLSPVRAPHSSLTVPGQILGTPSYMSPEQAAGDVGRIDKRSDVYSLGAILYEILTGQAPFADQTTVHGEKTIQALLRRIREEPPTRPRLLVPDVPTPLQAICLRALAKDPERRYQNAQDLAQEVQRWLADLPVAAHPDSWTVRVLRWARQHKTLVASLGVLVGAGVAGLAVTTFLLNQEQARTEAARAKAERNFHKAQEAVDRYFTQVSEDRLLNEPGMLPLRKELLASARDFYEDFAREQQQDPGGRQALGEARLKLARILRTMGERDQGLKILDDARALFEQLANAYPEVESYELGLAQTYLDHGYQSYLLKGRSSAAEADLDKGRDLLIKLVKKNPTRLYRSELAHALNTIGSYHENFYVTDDKAGAAKKAQGIEDAFANAVALWRQLADEEPTVPLRLKDLAGGYTNLAFLYANRHELDKAKDYLDKALALRQQLVERFPQSPDYQEFLAASYNNLGIYYRARKQPDEAEKAFLKAAGLREKLVRQNGHAVQFQQGLGKCYFNLGNLYFVEVDGATEPARGPLLTKGKQAYTRALETYKRLRDEHPEEHRLRLDYAITLAAMGDLMTQEKQVLAIPWYDQAITQLEEVLREGEQAGMARRSLRNSYWGRAEARTEAGQLHQAVTDWDRAIELDDGSHKQDWETRRREVLKRMEMPPQP